MKYKHIKSGIVVELSEKETHYYNNEQSVYIHKEMVEDSNDWEKVVEIPQEIKDKLMSFWENFEIIIPTAVGVVEHTYDGYLKFKKIKGKIPFMSEQQFKDYFGI